VEVPLKDIAIAVIGGAAGIAAILLVFVTFVVSRADALPGEAADRVIKRYTRVAKMGFIPLVIQVFAAFTAYWWLFHMGSVTLLNLWKYGFLAALGSFLLYAAWVLWML
jgi:hypothetical protein